MRGSALRASGVAAPLRAPRVLAGDVIPVHPDQEEALPLVGSPASERFISDTTDRRIRPLGTRAQGALLPKTPARKVGFIQLPPYTRNWCR
jgi:hypothetical protein